MADRPIIFSAPMVRALLAGRKVQTRRVIKGVPMFSAEYDRQWLPHVCPPGGAMPGEWSWWEGPSHGPSMYHHARVPYAVGDRLWVKETWRSYSQLDGDPPSALRGIKLWYEADEGYKPQSRTRASIHMPRWASRLTLLVTDVRVERLQDISEADAQAEGVTPIVDHGVGDTNLHWIAFQQLWDRLHGEGAWLANPWVAAIGFRVVRANIDAAEARAA